MKFMLSLMCCILAPVLAGCDRSVYDPDADEQGHSAPTQATIDANRQVLRQLPFEDRQDFEDAKRGFIAQKKIIDGVPFTFQYTPESEAPAELMFYLPEHKALCGAEVISRNMHNIYTCAVPKFDTAPRESPG